MRVILKIVSILLILAGCTNMDRPVDKSRLLPYDYRLFQGTEAWQLAKAAEMKDIRRVNQLLDDNPELANIADSVYGNTLLMLAIINQDYNLFKTLLENGANVNYYNLYNGNSPLIEACDYKENDPVFAMDLIEYGANVNDTSPKHRTPLMAAVRWGNRTLIEYLIKKGANIDYKADIGTNILGQSLVSWEYATTLLLLENGADYTATVYNTVDEHGKLTVPLSILEALRCAIPDWGTSGYRKKKEIIKFLKERGLDYDTVPIPEYVIKRIKEDHPLSWKWYLQNY
ncbi:MAG: ankyrin repeat domain-containing protein [Muribaculaceae bacterium]|nr:ankyrin repeat domain-containing protein [Muribaculaceae bacterium]